MNDFGLARLDGMGDPGMLRARAEEAMSSLEIDARPGAQQQGADASNSVWVTVAADGAVVDVSISRQWPERMSGDQLGAAVLSAYRQAEEKRALARKHDSDQDSDEGGPPAPAMPDLDDHRWLDWVWESLNDSRRRLDQMSSPRRTDSAAEEYTVAGPAGLVRLRVAGSVVREVLVDGVHTAERNPDALAVDVRSAFGMIRRG